MSGNGNVVVMGGSFNPPTIAHLSLIRAAMDALNAEAGYLSPVSHAYLKRKMVRVGCGHLCIPTRTRVEMVEAMMAEDARLRLYDGEIDEPFAMTLRTLEQLQQRHSGAGIWYVAGQDKLELLETLTRKWALLPRFNAVVFSRGGGLERSIEESPVLSACRASIAIVEPPSGIEGVSSTAVREHLFEPDEVSHMLHPEVLRLVRHLKREDYPEEIIEFKGEYGFLGNDFPAPVAWEGIVYPCAEAAFQASKSDEAAVREQFARLGPGKAKQRGNQITPRPGWEAEKYDVMRGILREKFSQNSDLRQRLLATGGKRLINGGKGKKDTCWGVNAVLWEGENRLGTMLMELREAFERGVYT